MTIIAKFNAKSLVSSLPKTFIVPSFADGLDVPYLEDCQWDDQEVVVTSGYTGQDSTSDLPVYEIKFQVDGIEAKATFYNDKKFIEACNNLRN